MFQFGHRFDKDEEMGHGANTSITDCHFLTFFLPFVLYSPPTLFSLSFHTQQKGNLQDAINANNLNHTRFPERDMLRCFRGVCYAVRALHTYRLPSVPMISEQQHEAQRQQREREAAVAALNGRRSMANLTNERTPLSEGDGRENGVANGWTGERDEGRGDVIPFAHRDIKPG